MFTFFQRDISYSLLVVKAQGMRGGREAGGDGIGGNKIRLQLSLEKEEDNKQTTMSITRIFSRSCCVA